MIIVFHIYVAFVNATYRKHVAEEYSRIIRTPPLHILVHE